MDLRRDHHSRLDRKHIGIAQSDRDLRVLTNAVLVSASSASGSSPQQNPGRGCHTARIGHEVPEPRIEQRQRGHPTQRGVTFP
jgi:hypothetical protein